MNMPKAGWRAPGFEQDDSHPVVCVSWQDAVAYAAWLKMKTGASYRLLSEAEAEYVARGTTKTGRQPRYFFGDDANDLCKYGNSADLTAKAKFTGGKITIPGMTFGDCNDGFALTAPAGRFKANAFGVKDVHGNALSWTDDCWHDSYKGAPSDGSAWTTACTDESLRVTRGGFWGGNPDLSRSAMRGFGTPVGRATFWACVLGGRSPLNLSFVTLWVQGEALESTRCRLGRGPALRAPRPARIPRRSVPDGDKSTRRVIYSACDTCEAPCFSPLLVDRNSELTGARMRRIGYARCSSQGQNLDPQIAALRASAATRSSVRKRRGKDIHNRPQT